MSLVTHTKNTVEQAISPEHGVAAPVLKNMFDFEDFVQQNQYI
jgi:hypothetical protein